MQHCSAGRDRQGCWCVSVACNQLSPWQNLALYGCTSTISMIPEGNFRKRENLYFLKQQRQPCFPFAIWIYRAVPASVVFCCRICFSGAVTPNHPYFPLPSLTWCSLWSSLVAPYSIGSVRAGAEIFFFPFPTSLFFISMPCYFSPPAGTLLTCTGCDAHVILSWYMWTLKSQ